MEAHMTRCRFSRRDERGFVTIAVFVVFLLLMSLASAGVVYSALDVKSTSYFDTGNQAFAAAESGIIDAISAINASGVVNFQNDVANRWSTVYGSSTKTMNGFPSLQYQVTVATSTTSPANQGSFTVTGMAPLSAKRVLKVGVRRSGFSGARGAIYLASDGVQSQFTGNAFSVDGNDHDSSGALVSTGPIVPGIATHSSSAASAVTNSLSDTQKDNVKGQGFSLSPLTPSVLGTGGATVDDLDQITANILSLGGVVTDGGSNFNGNQTMGTLTSPQITHLTADTVKVNGNLSGAGIMIVDGSLKISGTIDYIGWILVRGDTIINAEGDADDETLVLGNATIQGSLWTGHLQIKVGGSAIVNYCEACLQLADGMSTTGTLPRPIVVSSWQEVL
jgi:hypothetical protein